MKHINNGFAYITDTDGKVYSVSWQVQVSLDGVEVTHFSKREVRHPESLDEMIKGVQNG